MKVDTIPLLLSISKHLYFLIVGFFEGQKADNLMTVMNNINTLYQYCRFHITKSNMDSEFEPICYGVLGLVITLNTVSRDEHIPEAEQNFRTIKYQVRIVLITLPFHKCLDHMIIEIFMSQVCWLNVFPKNMEFPKPLSLARLCPAWKWITTVTVVLLMASMFKSTNSMVTIWWREQWSLLYYELLAIFKADISFIAY